MNLTETILLETDRISWTRNLREWKEIPQRGVSDRHITLRLTNNKIEARSLLKEMGCFSSTERFYPIKEPNDIYER